MVFNMIVRAAGQEFCNLGPLVSQLVMRVLNDSPLILRPGAFVDVRVEVIVPALTTLLADPAGNLICDLGPEF